MPGPGQWVPDKSTRSGFRWDQAAPAADPSPTYMLPVHAADRRERPVTDPIPSSPQVFNPELGGDGGGRFGGGVLPSIDPDNPVDHVDELDHAPDVAPPADPATTTPDIAICHTCGTAVARDRLR